ncbi:DMT family transporter [Rhizomonospora bruguierae]|uniref:DMT family transporter n=1 Tax=Rhizomonospora bruguierae TaxID=1581705 RepID=UPI001BD00BEF|nr:DMT family transporter [Micromonospora sp. NBRC 107566]
MTPASDRAGPVTVAALGVAVVAVAVSAPLIAYAAAPGLAIAFWRNAVATAALVPAAAATRGTELRGLAGPARRDALWCVLAGLALAVHFGTWVPSAQLTTVAAAAALVATQPAWQGIIAWGQGRRLGRLTWAGIALAVAGAVAATGADFGVSGRAFAGDLLALAGGVAGAAYTALGERARSSLSTTTYTTVCYGVCALVLLPACLLASAPLAGYPAGAWLAILALVAGPQLLGHSMFNYALRRVPATTVSVLGLLEVPGAALLAWVWLDQTPRPAALPGMALLLTGVVLVLLAARRVRPSVPLV